MMKNTTAVLLALVLMISTIVTSAQSVGEGDWNWIADTITGTRACTRTDSIGICNFSGAYDDFCFTSESENDIYVIASDGNVWHWNGAWWWQVTFGRVIEKRFFVLSSDAIYGLSKGTKGYLEIFKWNGDDWVPLTSNEAVLDDFHFFSETQIYAIGQDNQIHLWNGHSWSEITSGQLSVRDHIQVVSINEIYGIGTEQEILKWDGKEWEILTTKTRLKEFFIHESDSEIYAINENHEVCLWNGHSWRDISPGLMVTRRIVIHSLTEIFGLGFDGMIWQWNGQKWIQITNLITDAFCETSSIFYRVKFIEGILEAPAAILAFKDRLVIAGKGMGGSVYVREWTPRRSESWDSCRNSQNLGFNTWYPLDGGMISSPELSVENGTLSIYIEGNNGWIYRKQYIKPYQWSDSWELLRNHEMSPGPFTSAGFTVVPSNSSGYPSTVSLVKFKKFNTTQIKPDWIEDLIIYEIVTKQFTSPSGPGTGTFNSMMEKIDYLKDLGINAIWLSGHSWSDPCHFTNISTQYANIHPAMIDPSLGSDPTDIEKTEREFKELIQAVHQEGIKVFLDVISHGVMAYSPLVVPNSTFPSYVDNHPL